MISTRRQFLRGVTISAAALSAPGAFAQAITTAVTTDGPYLRLEQRISHEELSQIVGTTRPRITAFMQRFRKLGLVEDSGTRSIGVHRAKTREFLAGTDAE